MSAKESSLQEHIYFWLRFVAIVVPLLAFFHRRIIVFLSACQLAWKPSPKPELSDDEFVDRPELEAEFIEALGSKRSETVLVYGERGGGKTSLIQHTLKNHYGVIFVRVEQLSHNEAQAEMLERISKQIHAFKMSESREFVEDVFASCWVQPVIVVSLEAKCGGDALDGVITTSKILSYENRSRGHPRIVVDISGSRAAIDAGIQFAKRRVVGVSVGFFSETEALKYVVDRIPKSFKDPLRRQDIAKMIVDQFDCHVLKLEGVCVLVNKKQPTDKAQVQTIIKKEFEAEKKRAWDGWISFCKNIETSRDVALGPQVWEKVATMLLEKTQESSAISEVLRAGIIEADCGKSSWVTKKDIGLANSDAEYHPLSIDPFQTTVCLAGKAVVAALTESSRKALFDTVGIGPAITGGVPEFVAS